MTHPGPQLIEQNHAFVRSQKWDVAVLPFGATEPHNFHMPYGTDIYLVGGVARIACQKAYDKGAKVLCLPTIPFGVNTNHMQIPGAVAISIHPTTQLKIVTDVVESLEKQGIHKLLLLNGHGGNELKPILRELHSRTVFIALCNWYQIAADVAKKTLDHPGDHADEMETSVGLALFPELMEMDKAGPGTPRAPRFEAMRDGWVQIVRPWHVLTDDTGVGDPRTATAQKGQKLLDVATNRLSQFLMELAKSPIDDSFPL